MAQRSPDFRLVVEDVSLRIKDKVILQSVSAEARSGQILAIMGPTGSGKTSLLNVISGRQEAEGGSVMLNNQPFKKRLRRRMAFVQQQDIFFSQLTLWETLYFTAELRLPERMSQKDKLSRIDDLVDTLDMRKCLQTVIGDAFVRGLSGGEKKRASIACELLVDPDILLLDEPTSGLDSSTAMTIMKELKKLAVKLNKLVIITIHQPSSQIFRLLDTLVLLQAGRVAYCGSAKKAVRYFEKLGFNYEPHYNAADFLLDRLHSDEETMDRIITAWSNRSLHEEIPCPDPSTHLFTLVTPTADNGRTVPPTLTTPTSEDSGEKDTLLTGLGGNDVTRLQFETDINCEEGSRDKWPISWLKQYKVLSWRSLKQTFAILRQGYSVVQVTLVSIATGLVFFNTGLSLDSSNDILGMLYLYCGYWTFIPAMETISSYPAERGIVNKERAAGAYRLSAYLAAKMTSDLPLTLLLPTLMYTALFWATQIGGAAQFFSSLSVMLLQGLGMLLSVIFDDLRMAITVLFSFLISGYMIGGFFARHMPVWLHWFKYVSIFLYPFGASSVIVFSTLPPTPCNMTTVYAFPKCGRNGTEFVLAKDILAGSNITLPLPWYVAIIVAYLVLFRVAGYVVLRWRKKPPL